MLPWFLYKYTSKAMEKVFEKKNKYYIKKKKLMNQNTHSKKTLYAFDWEMAHQVGAWCAEYLEYIPEGRKKKTRLPRK